MSNEFDFGLSKRKAIYVPFSDAVSHQYIVDDGNCNKCGRCVEACERGAINLNEQSKESEVDVGTITVTIGHDLYEPPNGEFGYKVYENVITTGQLERLLNQNRPNKA